MENNITNLFKAINFMNKKTLIPTYDDYILIEDGSFILQDAYKTYVFSFDVLKNQGDYFFYKSDLLNLKTKNAKYFLEEIRSGLLFIKIVTKDSERVESIPLSKKSIGIKNIIAKEFTYSNSFETNGINLKAILNGYKDNITFKYIDNTIYVSMDENNTDVNFNEEFGELCTLSVLESNDAIAQIVGQNIVDAIGQFGLVKKNSTIKISFNEISFAITNNNLTIYILSNKL